MFLSLTIQILQIYFSYHFSFCSAHPYLFFNPDQHTMTFIGFNINRIDGNLVDQQTGQVLEKNIISNQLWVALQRNGVPLQENFNVLTRYLVFEFMKPMFMKIMFSKCLYLHYILLYRIEKIKRLCRIVGNKDLRDPDSTYELTTDNVKKMMAIYMRFRYS